MQSSPLAMSHCGAPGLCRCLQTPIAPAAGLQGHIPTPLSNPAAAATLASFTCAWGASCSTRWLPALLLCLLPWRLPSLRRPRPLSSSGRPGASAGSSCRLVYIARSLAGLPRPLSGSPPPGPGCALLL